MTAYGERVVSKYIKHPAAGADATEDADPLDAGSGMIVDSNTTHLALNSHRLLVETVGPGNVNGYQNAGDTWGGLEDVGPPPTISTFGIGAQAIPWSRTTAARFGPRPLIADHDLATGGVTARQVRVRMTAFIDPAITSAVALFALTTSPSAADLTDGRYLAFTGAVFAGTGAQTVTATLTPDAPVAPSLYEALPSGDGAGQVYVLPGWIWFGWQFLGSTLSSQIVSLSAWEVP